MARPRIVRKAEEAAAIPVEHPIQVELPPEGVVEVPAAPPATAQPQPSTPPQTVVPQISTKRDDDETSSLRTQVEQLKKASEDNARLAKEAADRETALRQQYETQGRDFRTAVSQRGQAELDAIQSGIMAATAEADSASQDMVLCGDSQDWANMAKAQARLSRAQTRLVQLEDTKATVEGRIEQYKKQQESFQQQPQFEGDPVEAHISRMQGVNNAQREWLRAHRDSVTDLEKNAYLQAAHFEAQKRGHSAGSPDYFQFLEEKLGYRPPRQEEDTSDEEELRPQVVAAPPSREAISPSGRTSPTRVTLTAEERQIAQSSGISEIEYARNKLKMLEAKKAGSYRE